MTFLSHAVLGNLFWIPPLFLLICVFGLFARRVALRGIFRTEGLAEIHSSASLRKRIVRIALLTAVLVLLVLAAARPAWGRQAIPEAASGHDLLFVFDVSKSMLSDDVKPSRLAHAKWLVRKLIEQNPGDRFGLIAFAGSSFMECPLTLNRDSVLRMTDALDTDVIPLGGTNVQAALETALKAFEGAEGDTRAIILLTDGDELTGRAASVVDRLAKIGVPVFAVGVGDPANPALVRLPDGKFLTDRAGNTVRSPLNETQLAELAAKTGGVYVRSTGANSGLAEIQARIASLERRTRAVAEERGRAPVEHPGYPLGAALVLFAVVLLIGEAGPRKLAALLFCLLPLAAMANEDASIPQEQDRLPSKDVPTASNDAPPPPLAPFEHYNAGLAAQKDGADMAKAKESYEKAIAGAQDAPEIRASAYQNLGCIDHAAARDAAKTAQDRLSAMNPDEAEKALQDAKAALDRAEEFYRDAMRSAPGSAPLVHNQTLLLADRKKCDELQKDVEELRKKLEEMKRRQQEAQRQAQQALDRQKQENRRNQEQQEQEQQKQEQPQDKQQPQDQKQDQDQQQPQEQQEQDQQQPQEQQEQDQQQPQDKQQPQDQKQEQDQQQDQDQRDSGSGASPEPQESSGDDASQKKSAQEAAEQARRSAEELERQAQELGRNQIREQAAKAKDELEKALENQRAGKGEDAERNLKNAVDALSGGSDDDKPQSKEKQEDKNKESKSGDKQDESNRKDGGGDSSSGEENEKSDDRNQDGDEQGERPPASPAPAPSSAPARPGELDERQAEAILDAMADDEKELRDFLKERDRRRRRPVEKDW